MMAEIYSKNGEELTVGLQGSSVCDEAIRAAVRIAKDLGEEVMLEDDDGRWTVYPSGKAEEGWDGDWD
jgi:hypothetical protein